MSGIHKRELSQGFVFFSDGSLPNSKLHLGRQTVISFHGSTLQALLNQFKWTGGSLTSTNQEVIVTTYVQE